MSNRRIRYFPKVGVGPRPIKGNFFLDTTKGLKVKELTDAEKTENKRLEDLYKAEDSTYEIDEAKKNREDRKDAGDVPGLCGTCLQLRWIKTRLGHRDRYWCTNVHIQRALPDGLLDTGDEVVKCPYYSPRPKPTDMSLRDMFARAIMIEIKTYEPGSKEDSINRGITYL